MSNLITLEDFNAQSAQYYVRRCGETFHSRTPHYHDHYQICYVLNGSITHCQGNDSVCLTKGDAYIVSPGFVHKLRFEDEHTELFILDFTATLLQPDFRQSYAFRFLQDLQSHHDTGAIPLQLTPDADQRSSMEALFACLLRQQATNCPAELSTASSLICAIVYLLAQCYYDNPKIKRQPWNVADKAQLLRRCIVYVDTHYAEPLNPDDLAKRFGMSRSALTEAFQQCTGLPLHKYIAQKRIQQSQMLIRSQADLPLNQIAAMVGYEDNSTFYRNFLRITGIAPAKYKELCLNNQAE